MVKNTHILNMNKHRNLCCMIAYTTNYLRNILSTVLIELNVALHSFTIFSFFMIRPFKFPFLISSSN